MGSPVSAMVADLVMKDVEERALFSCTHQPFFWKRHTNDTLPALPPDQTQVFHHHLSSIKPPIQFTIEEESQSLSLSPWGFCCWGSSLTCPCQAVVSSIVWLVWLISPNFFSLSCLIINLPPLYMISRHPYNTHWHTHPLLMSRSFISFVTAEQELWIERSCTLLKLMQWHKPTNPFIATTQQWTCTIHFT